MGEDEYTIILPETGEKEAENVYNRLKEKIGSFDFEDVPVSVSFGKSTRKSPDEDIYKIISEANEKMSRDKLNVSKNAKSNILKNILATLSTKINETVEHQIRMVNMSLRLGSEIGLSNSELNNLSLVAKLHDLGKINVPEKILNKKTDLNDEEWEKIKEHPVSGYKMLKHTSDFEHIAEEVKYHHERWDGTGYPEGLKGEDIPLMSRIVSLTDAYDVMTNDRPYKESMSHEKAIKEIKENMGTQFDPYISEKFIENFGRNNIL